MPCPGRLACCWSRPLIAWILGNLVGLVAGYFHTKRAATVLELVGILLYPIPYYILAVSLILLLAYVIPIFPLSPTFPVGQMTPAKIGMILYNSMLPALTLVLAGFGWNILSHEGAGGRHDRGALCHLCPAQGRPRTGRAW